jgi:LacI family transcriptional regulator
MFIGEQEQSGVGVHTGRLGLAKIVEASPAVTAIICANDYLAVGAIIEAGTRDISIPDDLTIVGFDDVELAADIVPALTTLRVPSREIGETIGRFITDRLAGRQTPAPGTIEADLIVRDTTGPPRRAR